MKSSHLPSSISYLPTHRLRIVIVGHVDHGKSTLIGRLLHDTGSLLDGKMESLKKLSEAEGRAFEFAFLLDAFAEEQAQNVTIDTTQIPFHTAKRDYVIIDAPGHEEFLKNMMTGAASANAALLLIDVEQGIKEQTRRHVQLLKLLGIRQIIVAINKMDRVDFSSVAFEKNSSEIKNLLSSFDLQSQKIIPLSAKLGLNITSHALEMPWYKGATILEALDELTMPPSLEEKPLRFMLQDVYREKDDRLIVGRVESGTLNVGEDIIFWPSGKKTKVRSIEAWNVSLSPLIAVAGQSIAITLEDALFVERGNVASTSLHPPLCGCELSVRLFWFHKKSLALHQAVTLQLGTQHVEATLLKITRCVDSGLQASSYQLPEIIKQNDVAEVTFHLQQPLVYDDYDVIESTGRLAILLNKEFAGAGIVLKAASHQKIKSEHVTLHPSHITCEGRAKAQGHSGAVIWLTGLSGAGKSTLAMGLESRLYKRGVATFVLDGDNLRHGLCADLGFSMADRTENIRRAGEVAKLFAQAGLVVICALISPLEADRKMVKASCARDEIKFIEVFVDAPLSVCEERDPRGLYRKARTGEIKEFTGVDSPYEKPTAPDLHLQTGELTYEETLRELYDFVVKPKNVNENKNFDAIYLA